MVATVRIGHAAEVLGYSVPERTLTNVDLWTKSKWLCTSAGERIGSGFVRGGMDGWIEGGRTLARARWPA